MGRSLWGVVLERPALRAVGAGKDVETNTPDPWGCIHIQLEYIGTGVMPNRVKIERATNDVIPWIYQCREYLC